MPNVFTKKHGLVVILFVSVLLALAAFSLLADTAVAPSRRLQAAQWRPAPAPRPP